jgi:hypothetical protein
MKGNILLYLGIIILLLITSFSVIGGHIDHSRIYLSLNKNLISTDYFHYDLEKPSTSIDGLNKKDEFEINPLRSDLQQMITDNFMKYSRVVTEEDVELLKSKYCKYDPEKNYNQIFDGQGTGDAPLSDEEWDLIVDNFRILDTKQLQKIEVPDSVDLTILDEFPKVGAQDGLGSCCAWATGYYANGFVQAWDHMWINAHNGDEDETLSPSWIFNLCNDGDVENGPRVGKTESLNLMKTVGICQWSFMDYNYYKDFPLDWGTSDAWRNAPMYRIDEIYEIDREYNTFDMDDIEAIKQAIVNYQPVIFSMNASALSDENHTWFDDDVIGTTGWRPLTENDRHTQTIVGYDDDKEDFDTGEEGAFLIVNSWGDWWGPRGDGYYWISYDAFMSDWNGESFYHFTDRYEWRNLGASIRYPQLLACFVFDGVDRPYRDAEIELGIGPYDNPILTKIPLWDGHQDVNHPYNQWMCVDVTEFFGQWTSYGSSHYDPSVCNFFLSVGSSNEQDGRATVFWVEYYKDDYYSSWVDPPEEEAFAGGCDTPGYTELQFCCDEIKPSIYFTIGQPFKKKGSDYYIAADNTKIWMNSTDYGLIPTGVYKMWLRVDWDSDHDGAWDATLSEEFRFDGLQYTSNYFNGDLDGIQNGEINSYFIAHEECLHFLQCQVIDRRELHESEGKWIYVDGSPPKTTISFIPPEYNDGTNNWITPETEIHLNPGLDLPHNSPCASGIKDTWYQVNGNDETPWTRFEECFFIESECDHVIEFYSVDNVENEENPHKIYDVKVDGSPPDIDIQFETTDHPDSVELTIDFNAFDQGSGNCIVGVDEMEHRLIVISKLTNIIDAGWKTTDEEYTWKVYYNKPISNHGGIISFKIRDKLGNEGKYLTIFLLTSGGTDVLDFTFGPFPS